MKGTIRFPRGGGLLAAIGTVGAGAVSVRVVAAIKDLVVDGRATIFEKKGDRVRAKATLEEALAFAASLPPAQRRKGMVVRLEKHLGQVGAAD